MVRIHYYAQDGHLGICQFVAITNIATVNILVCFFNAHVYTFLWVFYLRVELLEYKTYFIRYHQIFPKWFKRVVTNIANDSAQVFYNLINFYNYFMYFYFCLLLLLKPYGSAR